MRKLAKSTSAMETDTTLGASSSTRKFLVQGDKALVSVTGTASTNTLTVMASPTGQGGTFYAYRADGPDGTPATVTVTSTEVTDTDEIYSFVLYGPGQVYRIDSDGNGTPDWDIYVSGDVHIY